MAKNNSGRGQRTNTTSATGRKERSPTSTAHTGSRVEPSHATTQARTKRAAKTARGGKA